MPAWTSTRLTSFGPDLGFLFRPKSRSYSEAARRPIDEWFVVPVLGIEVRFVTKL